ncbi:hypothetical protein BDL97_12G000600 [Sphagnum fallax]|nr:hypothetical protein BDL97_12G000600 [Sphagnum fallax]
MAMTIECEWMTDNLRWKPYTVACSAAIEAAYNADESSVNLCIQSTSGFTHSITFKAQPPVQLSRGTKHSRPMRRQAAADVGLGRWQWWETQSQSWQSYDAAVTSRIEWAWNQCQNSLVQNQPDAPAGIVISIHHHTFSIHFEADAFQTNLSSHYHRKVRRRLNIPHPAANPLPSVQGSASTSQQTISSPPVSYPEVPNLEPVLLSLYNPDDLVSYMETSEEEECSICVSSLCQSDSVKLGKCMHTYHRDCIAQWFETRPTCPECSTSYGLIIGTQPPGTMTVQYILAGTPEAGRGLEGFPDTDIIRISYNFPNGIQSAEHPNPGKRYKGTRRVAFLPRNREGEEVLTLLKTAWERHLLFRVGTSVTTGQSDVVTWAGVHHKTSTWGGATNFGYPDETYFTRVKVELENLGVT